MEGVEVKEEIKEAGDVNQRDVDKGGRKREQRRGDEGLKLASIVSGNNRPLAEDESKICVPIITLCHRFPIPIVLQNA